MGRRRVAFFLQELLDCRREPYGMRTQLPKSLSAKSRFASVRASEREMSGYLPRAFRELWSFKMKLFAPPWETLHPKPGSFVSQ